MHFFLNKMENDIKKEKEREKEKEKNTNNNNEDNNKSLFGNNKIIFGDLFIKTSNEDNKNSLFCNNNNNKILLNKNNSLFSDNNNILNENDPSLFKNDNLLGKKTSLSKRDKDDEKEVNEENNDEENEENDDEDNEENNDEENEENNDEENGEEKIGLFGILKLLHDNEKMYHKNKNGPKPTPKLPNNYYIKRHKERCNTEIISLMNLYDFFMFFIDIKELKNGNYFLLFKNSFYYINSKTLQFLTIDESLDNYVSKSSFKSFVEINKELIGIIANNFVLIVQYNNKKIKFYQEIEIKANILTSFPSDNLIILNEYKNDQNGNKINTLYYYIYDENLKFKLQTTDEIKNEEKVDDYDLFNYIANIKKLNDDTLILFTQSTIPHEETQGIDANYMSFYERDYDLFLKIFLFDRKNKKLTNIYEFQFLEHCAYSDSGSVDENESEYGDFLNIWKDENMHKKNDNEIIFYIFNLSLIVIFNVETHKSKAYLFDGLKSAKNFFYDKNKDLYYIVKRDAYTSKHKILVYNIDTINNKINFINIIYFPFYFNYVFRNKKGNYLGVAQRSKLFNELYPKTNIYAPIYDIFTTLCLLNLK